MSNAAILERRSELHRKVAQECVKYLLLSEIGDQSLLSNDQAWAQTVDGLLGADVFDDGRRAVASTASSGMSIPPPDNDHFLTRLSVASGGSSCTLHATGYIICAVPGIEMGQPYQMSSPSQCRE
jgi:hypothetical protein